MKMNATSMRLGMIAALCALVWLRPGAAEDVPAATADAAAEGKTVIEMMNGDRVEGKLLFRDDENLYLVVGGEVIEIETQQVKNVTDSNGDSETVQNEKKFDLYKTGQRGIKNVQALVEELGQAVVMVRTPAGLGTGWFCHPDGYLVTNNHVIDGERSVTVTLFLKEAKGFGKKVFKKVRIVALNDSMDLALLKIEEPIGVAVPQLYIGDSTALQVGDPVFAIGNPLGLERSTSRGHISKAARQHEGRLYLQTTAPIAPGNSGGPLFNERGEVVGVVNMGAVFFDGLGFAIPSKYVKEFLDNIEAFAYDEDNPNSGMKYMEAPVTARDKSFAFTTSEWVKTGYGVAHLTLADLDNDGRQEVLFANNNKSEIGVLRYRETPEAEEETPLDYEDINRLRFSRHFTIDTTPVLSAVKALAAGDVNGDGRADAVFFGDIDGLAVLYQNADSSFGEVKRIEKIDAAERHGAIRIDDLDADGTNDIIVLGSDDIYVFWSGTEKAAVPLSGLYKGAIKEFDLFDVDGDGRRDIVIFAVNKHYAVHARLQGPNRTFLRELPLRSHLSGEVRRYTGSKGERYLTLDRGLNRIRELAFATAPASETPLPRALWSLPASPDADLTRGLSVGDVDGDGKAELVAADRKNNEFHLYEFENGALSARVTPAPQAINELALYISGDSRAALVCQSIKDKLFGLSRIDAAGISFPRPIVLQGETESLHRVHANFDGTARDYCFWIEKEKKNYHIRYIGADDLVAAAHDGKSGSVALETRTIEFTDKKLAKGSTKKPANLRFTDLNGDGRDDLIVYWAYTGKESLFLADTEGKFRPVIEEEKVFDNRAGQMLAADLDGDGTDEALLPGEGFLRVIKVDAQDKLYIDRQFNWSFEGVSHLASLRQEGGKAQLLALSSDALRLVRLAEDGTRFTELDRIDTSGLPQGDLKLGDLNGDGKDDLFVLTPHAVQVRISGAPALEVHTRTLFNATLEHYNYWNLHTASLSRNTVQEVLLFDSRKAMLEGYRENAEGRLVTLLRQRLFERSIFQRNNSESLELPQETVLGDVDGDGAIDFICILQDRIGLYLQQASHAMPTKEE